VTLHDLDVANAQPTASRKDVQSLLTALGKPRKTEITDKLRQEINKVVKKYISDGVAELVPGVLFIDEVHMLDMECFTYLNRSLESSLAPIVVLATNRGVTKIHGTNISAPHGIPVDLLDRLLIVPTHPYSTAEMVEIISIRAKTEELEMTDEALQLLGDIGARTSLRYAVQMLSPAKILAETCGRSEIAPQDIHSVDGLFLNGKASAQMLQHAEGFMQ
jgi:RuvB-like protein 1 (pontin 52)